MRWSASCFRRSRSNQLPSNSMAIRLNQFACGAALLAAAFAARAQTTSPAPAPKDAAPAVVQAASTEPATKSVSSAPLPIAGGSDKSSLLLVQASAPAPAAANKTTSTAAATTSPGTTTTAAAGTETETAAESGGAGVREFQGDDVGQVLRLLARQAKINMVVSDQIPPATTVTMRLEDVTALQAIGIIVKAKGLFMDKLDNVYYIKTPAEKTAEPTESDSFQFSYARAKDTAPLVAAQLASKDAPQVDERTNTMFYRETRSNIDAIRKLLVQIDKPTKQVMIEARLVEVTANPKQSYGINWAGVVGGSSNPQTIRYSGTDGLKDATGQLVPNNPTLGHAANHNLFNSALGSMAAGQF